MACEPQKTWLEGIAKALLFLGIVMVTPPPTSLPVPGPESEVDTFTFNTPCSNAEQPELSPDTEQQSLEEVLEPARSAMSLVFENAVPGYAIVQSPSSFATYSREAPVKIVNAPATQCEPCPDDEDLLAAEEQLAEPAQTSTPFHFSSQLDALVRLPGADPAADLQAEQLREPVHASTQLHNNHDDAIMRQPALNAIPDETKGVADRQRYNAPSHDGESFECLKCNQGFASRKSLFKHLSCNGDHTVPWSQLGYQTRSTQTNSSQSLVGQDPQRYQPVHHGGVTTGKASRCSKCNEDFPSRKKLLKHLDLEHRDHGHALWEQTTCREQSQERLWQVKSCRRQGR